jgi:hypothetical protein
MNPLHPSSSLVLSFPGSTWERRSGCSASGCGSGERRGRASRLAFPGGTWERDPKAPERRERVEKIKKIFVTLTPFFRTSKTLNSTILIEKAKLLFNRPFFQFRKSTPRFYPPVFLRREVNFYCKIPRTVRQMIWKLANY